MCVLPACIGIVEGTVSGSSGILGDTSIGGRSRDLVVMMYLFNIPQFLSLRFGGGGNVHQICPVNEPDQEFLRLLTVGTNRQLFKMPRTRPFHPKSQVYT